MAETPNTAPILPGNKVTNLGGIQFTCRLISHGASPADIEVTIHSGATEKKAVSFAALVGGTQGNTEKEPVSSKINVLPGNNISKDFATFGGSSILNPEFPSSCTLTDVLVCPMTPPKGYENSYYQPLKNPACLKANSVLTKARGSCRAVAATTVVVQSDHGFVHSKIYGVGSDPSSSDRALQNANEVIMQKGGDAADIRAHPQNYAIANGCDFGHGAVAGSDKTVSHQKVSPSGMEFIFAALANSIPEASQKALNACNQANTVYPEDAPCRILESW